ncbi:MAG: SDR family NAD(P)-dependent oxidoreductase [bacterium]|nr:SDR family NAD(P)-dependent oxidoreductase [bacterium]
MENKTVLITGASSGLGKALAHEFHNQGWEVCGIARRDMPYFVNSIRTNITSSATVLKGLEKILGPKKLDLCILNAGILGDVDRMEKLAQISLSEAIDVNCLANKPIIKHLMSYNNVNSVVAISSGAALKAYEGWGPYCISKAALEMMMKVYALENPNTNFTCLSPGLVKSPMQDYIQTIDSKKLPGMKKFHDAYKDMDTPEVVAERIYENLEEIISHSRIDLRDLKTTIQ